jgi:hypothetical protein
MSMLAACSERYFGMAESHYLSPFLDWPVNRIRLDNPTLFGWSFLSVQVERPAPSVVDFENLLYIEIRLVVDEWCKVIHNGSIWT